MRLPRRDHREPQLGAEAERELEALERVLTGEPGEPVEAEHAALATLATDLRAERAAPDRDWALELDQRAADGFGRAAGPPWQRLIGERRPQSLLAPAGALATLAVIAAVGISVSREGTGENGLPTETTQTQTVAPGDGGGSAETGRRESFEALDSRASKAAPEAELPAGAGAVAGEGGALDASGAYGNLSRDSDRLARGRSNRIEDRSASLVLQAETREVREVSDRAISIVQGAGGIVVSSNLSEQGRRAAAALELSIPTRTLDGTLEQLTDLATVKSLNEGSVDITKPFVSAEDRLKDARAERQKLLEALGNATTEVEAEAIRKQLDDARSQISRAEARFQNIARRGRLADVSLQIEGRPETDDGSWSLGEAADDALDVLRTVAGVLLISAAILVPLGALVAIATLALLAIRRRRRERALDD